MVVALWLIVWLALLDIGVNLAFGADRKPLAPGLQQYFEYGRSVEGKLASKIAGISDSRILSSGWIEPEQLKTLPDRPRDGADLLVAVYGQSFAMHAANGAAALDRGITLRAVGGPAAPPNHSYAAYGADAPLRKADVVVFSVLSQAIGQMASMSGLIPMFENPAPFTYPRYRLKDDRLVAELPVIRSEAQFRDSFARRSDDWQRFKAQLRESDRGYDRVTFDETFADASSIVRLLRRGWVAHSGGYIDGVYVPGKGFDPDAEEVKVLRAMLVELSRQTRVRGERLVVLLLHTKGHGDHLHAALERTLKQAQIDYISTHSLFSANHPSNFVADGHYTKAANGLLSKALADMLRGKGNGSQAMPRIVAARPQE